MDIGDEGVMNMYTLSCNSEQYLTDGLNRGKQVLPGGEVSESIGLGRTVQVSATNQKELPSLRILLYDTSVIRYRATLALRSVGTVVTGSSGQFRHLDTQLRSDLLFSHR